MNKRTIASLSLSALMLGGTIAGVTYGGIAVASSRSDAAIAKAAAGNAAKASKALAKGDPAKAIGFAEAAVALMPQDASYRTLLGAAYLKAGRFTSAHAAYADVLQLSPGNGKATLNLALAMIAEGQWDEARKLLDANAATVPASDRGLAIALAGDPVGAVELLTVAARSPDADAKTRQNLALALALAGRWAESRQLVGVDMAPLEADARIVQWAAFAKPVGAADQVSALLGVVPVKDPGQPVALALNATVPVSAMAAAEETVEPTPVEPAVEVAAVEAEAPAVAMPSDGTPRIVFGERREIVQALPASSTALTSGASKTRLAAVQPAAQPVAATPAKGNWFVQLGAYDNAGVAKDAWDRATRRYPALAQQAPTGMAFKSFYRLSVGGFSRASADTMCRGYRAKGGACFVRTSAGDQMAQWAKPAKTQMAAR
ncbi:SPOR domain-containing protein [Sphingomonas radiodurans]|uniref:SPOR domain-containing protein n=1 Tax=Sphingomonas radiodurans TaxID=2890321 RepID=UPI001E32F102|nr:SPOR domain-containing protein [Sphingomonas radiodurans]WBH16883.1 tetratricopeptide repeat protein [Sphingomonas radiodurans]